MGRDFPAPACYDFKNHKKYLQTGKLVSLDFSKVNREELMQIAHTARAAFEKDRANNPKSADILDYVIYYIDQFQKGQNLPPSLTPAPE